jgi:hypothetical protein
MPLSLRASIPLATVAAVVVGCSAPVVDDVADASLAMTEGVVLVERTVAVDGAVDGAVQSNVSAKFMRLSTPADPDLAERVVGSKLDQPAVGSCRRLVTEAVHGINSKTPAWSQLGTIELIDVGDVTLRTGTATMPLAARAFPDVGDLVSGMFYTSRDAASDLPAAAIYTLEGTGSAFVDRFTIEAEAPATPEDVRVGSASLAEGPTLEASQAATVRWRGVEARDQAPRDLVLVDVSAASGASIRCAFRDAGRAQLPGWIFGAAVLGPLPAAATIAVHRVRERSFVAPGLDTGALRFDLSVVGHATVTAKTLAAVPAPASAPASAPQP